MPRLLDYAERLFVLLLAVPFLVAFAAKVPTHPSFIAVTASELLSVAFVLARRRGEMKLTPYAFLIAIGGTALPLLVRPYGGVQLAPEPITSMLMVGGLVVAISAKLFLNRSFGMVAANRGVKRGGPYRVVRHPMYLGYITTQIGFLLASFSVLNLGLYCLAWLFQILRIREEEKLLMADPAYADFARVVRRRLIPGVY